MCSSIMSKPACRPSRAAATNCAVIAAMSSSLASIGTWLTPSMYCSGEAETIGRLGHAGIVEITTASGQRYARRVDKALGDPTRPLTDAQLVAKFRDCAQHAANRPTPETLDQVIALIDRLERAPDVRALTALLRGAERSRSPA